MLRSAEKITSPFIDIVRFGLQKFGIKWGTYFSIIPNVILMLKKNSEY